MYGENEGVIGESWLGYGLHGMLRSRDLAVEAGLVSGAAQFINGCWPKSNGREAISALERPLVPCAYMSGSSSLSLESCGTL